MTTEVIVDHESGLTVWDETDDPSIRADDLIGQLKMDPMIATLTRWQRTSTGHGGAGQRSRAQASLFDRDRFVTPEIIYDQFRVAQDAAENDEVVGGWLDTTEQLAFGKVEFRCGDPEQEDIWNQIAEGLHLTESMRRTWRGYSVMSQVYPCVWWATKTLKVRDVKTPAGKSSKKVFDRVVVPTAITHLDPEKVLPVGNLLFGQEQLAYIADPLEVDAIDAACAGDPNADPLARQLIVEKYEIQSDWERRQLMSLGVPLPRLYTLNPDMCWRYTATRMEYERFAALRMKPVFELLDLKHQLRQSDRAHLVGSANFILLVRKGTDRLPAKQVEIDALNAQMSTIGRVPMIVGDHRLTVEILTPKTDLTLDDNKHGVPDSRITAYLYKMFMTAHLTGGRSDDQVKIAKIVAAGLQAARRRQGESWEEHVIARTMRLNPQLTETPTLKFWPRRIELDFDPALAQLLLDIYDRGDVSRDTILSLVGIDQATEAELKKMEADTYDNDFHTQVPYNGPPGGDTPPPGGKGEPPGPGGGGVDPRQAGRQGGGNRGKGGAAPGSGQGQPPKDPRPKPPARRGA